MPKRGGTKQMTTITAPLLRINFIQKKSTDCNIFNLNQQDGYMCKELTVMSLKFED